MPTTDVKLDESSNTAKKQQKKLHFRYIVVEVVLQVFTLTKLQKSKQWSQLTWPAQMDFHCKFVWRKSE